ncbi:MAG: peptidoglycan-binding domain-containing protein [Cyanobacteria bacterium J06639_16]
MQLREVIDCLEPELLKLGDTGFAVQSLQRALKELLFYNSPVDGYFGPDTEKAILKFQKQLGLDETAVFDPATWYALTFWTEPFDPNPAKTAHRPKPQERWHWRLLQPFFQPQ